MRSERLYPDHMLDHAYMDIDDVSQQIVLPTGIKVQLRHLQLSSDGGYRDNCDLLHLEYATQLTHMQLQHCNLSNGDGQFQPDLTMPVLQSLTLVSFMDYLPSAFWNLSNLQTLNLCCCDQDTMVDEIGTLSSLKHLDMSASSLIDVPNCVFDLSQLESLNISDIIPPLGMPDSIVELHTWPNLTRLDFRLYTDKYSWLRPFYEPRLHYTKDSQLNLLQLHEALGPRSDVLFVGGCV